jgi:hypothetical protein
MTLNPTLRRFGLQWLALIALIGVELVLMLLRLGPVAPFVALGMAAIVILGPMRLREAPTLAHVVALAGVFWLVVVLFGLGTLDPLTRHDLPTHFRSEP